MAETHAHAAETEHELRLRIQELEAVISRAEIIEVSRLSGEVIAFRDNSKPRRNVVGP